MKFFRGVLDFKNRLTSFSDDEPLTKLALVVVIFLDIFILSMVFGGLKAHTSQLTSPHEYIPYNCRNVFINKQWSDANKLDKLQPIVLARYNNYSYRYESYTDKEKMDKMHALCRDFYQSISSIYESKKLKDLFVQRQALQKENKQWTRQHRKSKDVYDTSLLEDISRNQPGNLNSVSAKNQQISQSYERINSEIESIDLKILKDPLIDNLWSIVKLKDNSLRQQMIKDLRKFEKIYVVKQFFWELIFLLPLLLAFYFWHSLTIKKKSSIQTLISSHLLVVASIPIVFKLIHLVLELVPFHFFKDLFKWLKLLHIVAIWHYFVIFLAIIGTICLVYLIQKKILNKSRLEQKRLSKGLCYHCAKAIMPNVEMCPFCGAKQFETCGHCSKRTYIAGSHCINCGTRKEKESK